MKLSDETRIDLVWLGDLQHQPAWPCGQVWSSLPAPRAVQEIIENLLATSSAQAVLFWDRSLGLPDPVLMHKALTLPGDLWHAGLRLGLQGQPGLIDFVAPTWMLNRDPDLDREATSWRLSLRCCLVRTEVLRQMGSLYPGFRTLEGASLAMGHRYIKAGVFMRHVPWLLPEEIPAETPDLPFADEVLFLFYRYGRVWSCWALLRAVVTGYVTLGRAVRAWKSTVRSLPSALPTQYERKFIPGSAPSAPRVSVLIPTLNRYAYLRVLLDQLRQQTVKPHEIILIDQSPPDRRDNRLLQDFADLPLHYISLDQPGQCSSRNAGLQAATGDYIFFLDDDDEISPDLLELHLCSLQFFRNEVSAGVAYESGAGPLPRDFTFLRASDVFPTNNTLVDRQVLQHSGLFDLAYDRGVRADGDLGMRIYLSGFHMVLNPAISVLHHRAPAGGLRQHKARVITYASSRRYITHRHLPHKTEIYLTKRYFTSRQVRESLCLSVLGTFSIRGSRLRRTLKVIVSSLLLPDTWRQITARAREADQMLQVYPRIPELPGDTPALLTRVCQ
jgi:glycosyltransferase involved in cell wall biosynthesis